jgi:hypothetical protein
MRRLLALALACAALPAAAQSVFKCTTADGRVTYQEVPCDTGRTQRKVDLGLSRDALNATEARRELERDYYRSGSELSGRFANDAREKERERWTRDLREREEIYRRAREEALRVPPELQPWMPPWGFPARPGLARPGNKPN